LRAAIEISYMRHEESGQTWFQFVYYLFDLHPGAWQNFLISSTVEHAFDMTIFWFDEQATEAWFDDFLMQYDDYEGCFLSLGIYSEIPSQYLNETECLALIHQMIAQGPIIRSQISQSLLAVAPWVLEC